MDLHRNTFLLFKVAIAGSALLLQLLAIEVLGSEMTGIINRYQLIALSISLLIFPGLEMSLIRFLPIEKDNSTISYQQHMTSLISFGKLTYITSIAIILLFFITLIIFRISNDILIIISFILLLFNCRIIPLLFRIERNMVGSILSEPGIISIFTISSILLLAGNIENISPSIILSTPIFLSSLLSLILLKSLTIKINRNSYQTKKWGLITDWYSLIREKYSLTFVFITASNYSMLWGLATLGAILLPPEEVAIYVTILRLFSVLLFVEGAVVAYYLPSLVKDFSLGVKPKEFNNYRNYMVFGTIIVSIGLIFMMYLLNTFEPTSFEFYSVIILSLLQILIASMGSPFAIAAATIEENKIKRISLTLLALSMVSMGFLVIFHDWRIIVIAFATLQLIRFFLGKNSLSTLLKNKE